MVGKFFYSSIVLLLTVFPALGAPIKESPISRPQVWRVFVDAGHGGHDAGTQGVSSLPEKHISLRLSNYVKQSLMEKFRKLRIPAETRLSRQQDSFLSLGQRVEMANRWNADLFISLHANSSPTAKAKGFEVYFLNPESTDEAANQIAAKENREEESVTSDVLSILRDIQATMHLAESGRLAETLFRTMSLSFRPNVNGVRQAPFSVLRGTSMPAVLIEAGYLTSPEDARSLSTPLYLKRLAGAISSGIVEYLLSIRKLS